MVMQKPRHPATFAGAVASIIGAMGIEAVCATVRRAPQTVYAWADPDQEPTPNIAQAAALDAAYVRAGHGSPPLQAAYEAALAQFALAPAADASIDPRDRMGDITKAVGDLAGEIRVRLADGSLSATDQCAIAARAADAVTELQALISDSAPRPSGTVADLRRSGGRS